MLNIALLSPVRIGMTITLYRSRSSEYWCFSAPVACDLPSPLNVTLPNLPSASLLMSTFGSLASCRSIVRYSLSARCAHCTLGTKAIVEEYLSSCSCGFVENVLSVSGPQCMRCSELTKTGNSCTNLPSPTGKRQEQLLQKFKGGTFQIPTNIIS